MKEIGNKLKLKGEEYIIIMNVNMIVIGKMEKKKEKEYIIIKMGEKFMKGIIKMIKRMEKEFII